MKIQAILLCTGIAGLVLGALQAKNPSPPQKGAKPDLTIVQVSKRFAQAKPEDYIGDQACVECHSDVSHSFEASAHNAFMADPSLPLAQRGCEGCHGPGRAHKDNPDEELISFAKLTPKESAAACLRCHGQTMDPSHWWDRTDHARANLSCVTCHQIHPDTEQTLETGALNRGRTEDPRSLVHEDGQPQKELLLKADEPKLCGQCHQSELAKFRLNFHHPVPEGRLVCSDCHAVHPTKQAQVRRTPFKSACVVCHQEKAGPFVYEHDPAAGWDGTGCVECHEPHGSQNPDMLNSRSRGLCAQCHSDKLANHHPGETCWSSGCHVATHGSNSNPDFLQP